MTGKRFKIDLDEEAITDNGEYCLSLYCFQDKGEKDVVELLNALNEENEQLKSFKSRVFNLLQDEIKEENELLDYYLKEKAPCNADRQQIIIGVLKRLQKELKE